MWICSYVNCPKSKPDTFGMNNRTYLAHAGLLPAKRWGAVARTLMCHFLKNLKLITSTHCANKILQNCSFKERSLKHIGHLKHIIKRKNARLMWYSWCIAFSKWSFKLVIIVLLFTGLWENSACTTAATVWQRATHGSQAGKEMLSVGVFESSDRFYETFGQQSVGTWWWKFVSQLLKSFSNLNYLLYAFTHLWNVTTHYNYSIRE